MAGPIDAATFANLVEMTGGDLEFVDELVDTYLEEGDRLVERSASSPPRPATSRRWSGRPTR